MDIERFNRLQTIRLENIQGVKLLNVTQVAQRLGVSPKTIYRKVKNGELPAIKIGQSATSRLRFRPEDISVYEENCYNQTLAKTTSPNQVPKPFKIDFLTPEDFVPKDEPDPEIPF